MNKKTLKVLKWSTVIFLSLFLLSQLHHALVNPVTTDTVYKHSSYKGYKTDGIVIRNEEIIESDLQGAVSYEINNGGRVAKGGTIAVAYSDMKDADSRIKAEALDKRIETLESIQSYNDFKAADISSVNGNIYKAMSEITKCTQNGKVEETDFYNVLLENMARKQIITGQVSNFDPLIAQLKTQRDSLNASAGNWNGKVESPKSGYVIYTVDGYENVFDVDNIDKITAEQLENISPEEISTDAICKIVSDYEWYIATSMPFNESLNLKQGSRIKLKTELPEMPEINATVKFINKETVGNNTVVIFSCDTMNYQIAQHRKLKIDIIYEEYTGLKVDRRAIRVIDGQKGVYALIGSQVRFIPIDELWSGEKYSIVKKETSDKRVLRTYDEIIVKGKNLHDGKIINR